MMTGYVVRKGLGIQAHFVIKAMWVQKYRM